MRHNYVIHAPLATFTLADCPEIRPASALSWWDDIDGFSSSAYARTHKMHRALEISFGVGSMGVFAPEVLEYYTGEKLIDWGDYVYRWLPDRGYEQVK